MPLLETINRLARRLLWIHGAAGVAWAAVAAGLVLGAGVWFDLVWELAAPVRIGNAILAVAAIPLVLVGAFWLGIRRAHPDAVARRLDRAQGAAGSVRVGVELALTPPLADATSRGLAGLAIDRASRDAASIASAKVVPVQPVVRAWAGLAAFAAIVGVVMVAMPRLVETEWLRWSDPFGDHPPYSRLSFEVEPAEIRVVYGAPADIRVRVEGGTAAKLDLMLSPKDAASAESLPMFPEEPGQWRATLTSVTQPGEYWVRAGSARSVRHPVRVITVPAIEEVIYKIEPPAYVHRAAYEGPLPQGGVAGLPGTKVTVRARSNRPLASGQVVFEEAGSLDLAPADATAPLGSFEVLGTFELSRAGKGRLRVADIDGQESIGDVVIPIAILADEAPRVRIVEPPAFSMATPTASLPVTVFASDDYGLAKVRLFRSLNDSRPLAMPQKMPAVPPLRWSQTEELPLAAYGLAPGDVIKLQARAEDTYPGGPNVAQSGTITVKIISQEQYDRMNLSRNSIDMLLSKYQQARRHIENHKNEVDRLRKKRKETPDSAESRAALQKELEALADRLQKSAEALDKLAKQQLPYEIDELLRKQLERSARQLQRLADRSRDLSRSGGAPSATFDSLEEMLRALEEMNDTLSREATIPLEVLAAIEPFLEQAAIIEIVHRRQKALVARLEGLKDKVSKEAWRRPSVEAREIQEDIRKQLVSVLDKLEDLLGGLYAKELDLEDFAKDVRDFIDAVRKSGVIEAMSDAERELERSTPEPGYAAAKKALDLLEELLKQHAPKDLARGMGGGPGRPRFTPAMREALQQTLARMLGERGNGSSSSDNVGLYGGSDLPRDDSARKSGRDVAGKTGGRGVGSPSGDDRPRSDPRSGDSAANPTPGAGSEAAVPSAYRRRVADYFERIAEETSPKR